MMSLEDDPNDWWYSKADPQELRNAIVLYFMHRYLIDLTVENLPEDQKGSQFELPPSADEIQAIERQADHPTLFE